MRPVVHVLLVEQALLLHVVLLLEVLRVHHAVGVESILQLLLERHDLIVEGVVSSGLEARQHVLVDARIGTGTGPTRRHRMRNLSLTTAHEDLVLVQMLLLLLLND